MATIFAWLLWGVGRCDGHSSMMEYCDDDMVSDEPMPRADDAGRPRSLATSQPLFNFSTAYGMQLVSSGARVDCLLTC